MSVSIKISGDKVLSTKTYDDKSNLYAQFCHVDTVPLLLFEFVGLILTVIDHPRKILITEYRLPLHPLKPFYPYHLELQQVREN